MGLLNQTPQEYYQDNDFGNYQFTSLDDIINQFMVVYVGEDKIIPKAKRLDVAFHAQRAIQELSFDTFKSFKAQEIVVPASLQMILPQDYVNYTKISWVDSAGIKHRLYPTLSNTSNPEKYQVDSNNEFLFDVDGNKISSGELIKNGNFHGGVGDWLINQQWDTATALPPITLFSTTVSTVLATDGDPEIGWFFGYNGNAIAGYDIPQWNGIRQENIPIISGEEYKISVDVSGFTSGEFSVVLVDKDGDITDFGNITADGTFTATATAGGTSAAYSSQSVFIRNKSATAGNIVIDNVSVVKVGDEETSSTWSNYKSHTPSENNNDDYEDDTYWPMDGERYGLDPQHAQANGSFYIDQNTGKIHFSSNISGKTVILDYISDGLAGSGQPMGDNCVHYVPVHKFAEEAMYKWISHAILASRANTPEYLVNRYKKERFAAVRQAKLRLSNIKLEEITQILRGKSKHIKH